jgi:adenylate cyclase
MDPAPDAWLELPGGEQMPLGGSCSLGRSTSNRVVVADEKVSRRHCIINVQDGREFWLVDLGSSNGTYLNERRVTQPIRLQHRDKIEIGTYRAVFSHPAGVPQGMGQTTLTLAPTLVNVRMFDSWLLLTDIAGSTGLAQTLSEDELPVVIGQWFSRCREIVESCGGVVNKYLGDGFFVYWPQREGTEERVVTALRKLQELQAQPPPRFRVVLHFGRIYCGGAPTMGEESLSGNEVNFIFRAEKLAGAQMRDIFISEPAREKLAKILPTTSIGSFPVASFPGTYRFYEPTTG